MHRVGDLRLVSNDRYHPLEIKTVYTDPARTEQLRKLGKDYHMLPRLVQPNLGVFIRRGCETKQRCSNGTT
jgi:hypothetical protein